MMFGFFFFNDTATTEIYTLSLHDALPIFEDDLLGLALDHPEHRDREVDGDRVGDLGGAVPLGERVRPLLALLHLALDRSEEHTSELQSRQYLVCRLLLEKKTYKYITYILY